MTFTNSINGKRKRFLLDIFINILSSASVALILQFLVYPIISKKLDKNSFGEILTIMGVINIISVMLGNSLNNIRLIVNNEYEDDKVKGDFIPLLIIASLINITGIFIVSYFFSVSESFSSITILVFISLLTMMRSYLSVQYRLKIDFRMIFFHSIVYCVGLFLGASILWYGLFSVPWAIVFLCGEMFSFIFLLLTTNLHKEPMKITSKFKSTTKQYLYLAFSGLIGNILVYLDRLIILPFLGGGQVAVYFAATIIGKMSSFVLQPISSVLLTYFSKSRKIIRVKDFWIINFIVIIFSGVALLGCVILSSFILKHLYPNLYNDASSILVIANLAAILTASSSVIQTIILRYCKTFWQVVIQTIYGATYIVGGVLLIGYKGLIGFCIAGIISVVVKILLMLIVGTISLRKENLSFLRN